MAQMRCLLGALCRSGYRARLGLLAAALLLVIGANTYGQLRLNAWNGSFFDTLEQRSVWTLGSELVAFAVIVSGLLALVVAQTWFQELLKIRLREWLTHDLLDDWMAPKRAYLLSHAGEIGVNPDQRMQDDARHFAELSAQLAVGLLQATLLLVSFIGVLWILSSQVVFKIDGRSFTIPGYMVWCALLYAAIGSWLTWLVGRPLIRLNTERCAREAELRSALVRVNESAEAIAFHRGERDERRILDGKVAGVVSLGRELARNLARLTWITSGFGWLAIVVPIIVAAPGFFGGMMTLGALMMVVGAFNQVQQSLRWFVDNFPAIATWRATLLRIAVFRDELANLSAPAAAGAQIAIESHPEGKLAFRDLNIALPDGNAAFDEPQIEVGRGERVLIVGEPGSGKAKLLCAVAGLWPWGGGTILLPPPRQVMFMPPQPYLPLTTLRAALTYPLDPDTFDEMAIVAALERVGAERLVAKLDERARWDKALAADEQQGLALARLLLHAPQWVFFEASFSSMSEEHYRLIRSIFANELAEATVIGTSSSAALNGFFKRTLRLRRAAVEAPRPAARRPLVAEPAPAAA
jgi:putative ATP-binding cassette transporter